MTKRLLLIGLLLNLLLVSGALAQEATAPATAPAAPWMQISLADAVCARGTPYSFFLHEGDPDRLLVYFQGGGACWNADTCKPGGTFDDAVQPDELDHYAGIFDFTNPQNPVADYSVVVVAYCTGDVHTGAAVQTYSVGATQTTIHFTGFSNAEAVLAWVYAHYASPSRLIVTGSSAGAYGAIFNAPALLAHYPDAQAVVFGDAGIGVLPADWDGFTTWGTRANVLLPAAAEATSPEFTNQLYTAAAEAFPAARIAEYTSYSDAIQTGFYKLMGGAVEDWVVGLENSFSQLDKLANFRSYIGWGGTHTILVTPLFYQMQVGGVAFRDWFAALTGGALPDDIRCGDCLTPEFAATH